MPLKINQLLNLPCILSVTEGFGKYIFKKQICMHKIFQTGYYIDAVKGGFSYNQL